MVDFIRIFWRDKTRFEHFVCQEENFEDLETLFGYHTSQIKYPYKASFNSMDVKVTEKYGYVYNSIHKSYNDRHFKDAHNHNDFGYQNLCEMVEFLESKLIDVDNSALTQFEFGLNIEVPTNAEDIIQRNILMHKECGPNHTRVFRGRGRLKQFDHHNYVIKIYDKAKQYNLSTNLLRVEIRFLKAKEFHKLDIFKLKDLKDKSKLRKLFLLLLSRFNELTIVDEYDEATIPHNDLEKLIRYSNPHYSETTIAGLSATSKMRHLRVYKRLLAKHNLLKTKSFLKQQLVEKYLQLINF